MGLLVGTVFARGSLAVWPEGEVWYLLGALLFATALAVLMVWGAGRLYQLNWLRLARSIQSDDDDGPLIAYEKSGRR